MFRKGKVSYLYKLSLNPTFNQQDISDKYAILDIKARAVGYGYVNVEIQLKIRLS